MTEALVETFHRPWHKKLYRLESITLSEGGFHGCSAKLEDDKRIRVIQVAD